jgi:hypothetical protein
MQFLKDLFLTAIGFPLIIAGAGFGVLSFVGFASEDKWLASRLLGFGVLCLLVGIRVLALRGSRRHPFSLCDDTGMEEST